MERKKKCQNFTASDRALLLQIANEKRNIIESKKTDAITWRQKQEGWRKIANQYNASTNGAIRTAKQLKFKYESIKKELKKKHSHYSAYLRGTGVKPPQSPQTEEEKILAKTISLNIQGLTSVFDSDGSAGISGVDTKAESESEDVATLKNNFLHDFIEVEWHEPNGQILHTPIDSQLTVESEPTKEENIESEDHDYSSASKPQVSMWKSRRRPLIKNKKCLSSAEVKFEDLLQKKCNLVELQEQIAKEQLQQQKIEHKKRVNLLDLQIEEQKLKNKTLKTNL